MLDFSYNSDQVKYFTRIREFQYQRPNPQQAQPRIQPLAMLSLPLPVNMPGDAYNEIIREFNLGELGSSVDVVRGGFSSASIAEQTETLLTMVGLGGVAYGAVASKKSFIGDILGLTGAAATALDYIGAEFGKTRNPHTAMIFDMMGIRHFNLNFLLAPRDEQQSRSLDRMLFYIRSKMHPSFMRNNAFVVNYPSMFTVEFQGLQNRMGIPRIDHSFLRSMNINASPQGQVYFKDGWPALIEVQMEFVELEAKTRDYFTETGTSGN